ncbi:DUF1045 domain-containing protein [Crenobacter luteus]|nr:DUF1045 domain-containing protein [Crenobacter luteus]
MMRLAIYATPGADTVLWRRGSAWLGRDAVSDTPLEQPALTGVAPHRLAALTGAAARYGWHATVRPPFALATGADARAVLDAVAGLAARYAAFDVPLEVGELAGFPVLRPTGAEAELAELAAAATVTLAPFVAPLDDAEIGRRAAGFDRRRQTLTARWGYPHLFEHYRFHFTLAAPCAADERARLAEAARRHFGAAPLFRFDALSVFVEPVPDAPFRLLARCPFGGGR